MNNKSQNQLFPFTITIADGFSKYEYKIEFPEDVAIYDIIEAIGKKFKVEVPKEGKYVPVED